MRHDETTFSVNFIKKQFLCQTPLQNFEWKQVLDDNSDNQCLIIENTVKLPSVLQYPIKIDYQKAFLKYIIQHLEKQKSVIQDCIYEEYGRLVSLPSDILTFKHYFFENRAKSIILRESVPLISEGTTGLRTWQAALALSEWIFKNRIKFSDKTILELGSGIGLTGLTLSLNCDPKNIILSDCHPAVLKTLRDNIKINQNLNNNEDSKSRVEVLSIAWEEVNSELCNNLGVIDKIIAADIVYDEDLFKPLINAINCLFKYCEVDELILSCTERNKATLRNFLALLSENKYRLESLQVPAQDYFLWSTETPVKIFSIKPLLL